MDDDVIVELQRRTERLERRLRFVQGACAVGILGLLAYACASVPRASSAQSAPSGILRVRGIIVEDEAGRARIVLGAPVPDPSEGRRRSASVGLVINDPEGIERFGLGLTEDGSVGMGFDAPPGTGDPRNRERINLGANADGTAFFRFVDGRTLVPFRLYTDEENRAWIEFLEFEFADGAPRQVTRRRLGFSGWDTIQQSMQR